MSALSGTTIKWSRLRVYFVVTLYHIPFVTAVDPLQRFELLGMSEATARGEGTRRSR